MWQQLPLGIPLPICLAAVLFLACGSQPEQEATLEELIEQSDMHQVACLDVNGDGRINEGDATEHLPDITGNDETDGVDHAVVRRVDIALLDEGLEGCGEDGGIIDWQVADTPEIDCATGSQAVLLFPVGGGEVNLSDLDEAAGVRWMFEKVGDMLEEQDVPYQFATVAPALNGVDNFQLAAENWATSYLEAQFEHQPCLRVAMLGHSHGGATVTAIASNLEADGFADKVLNVFLIDRVVDGYTGTDVLPETVPIVNFFLDESSGGFFHGAPIDGPNVENVEMTGALAPEHGQDGGELVPAIHTNIDNSPDVLDEILRRVEEAFAVQS